MTPEQEKKQKWLAVITVLVIFLLVGTLFLAISLNNKNRTEALKIKVLTLRRQAESQENLARLSLSSSTPVIEAKAYFTLAVTDTGQTKILAEKNANMVLPIASLTKLLVGVVVLENLDLNTRIKASLDYIGQEESAFVLETDHSYSVKDLLAAALISSDNDSARLLSSAFGTENLVDKLNAKARELSMASTTLVNVTGLDPKEPSAGVNLSTARDLATLLQYIAGNHPQILAFTDRTDYNICDTANLCKTVHSTNKLLTSKGLKYQLAGGKTGSTDLAGRNLALLVRPYPGLSVINIVLGALDSFAESAKIINNINL
jgi:D-alanyl-D-alanine carboxypeptidase